jgi:hypothetical protein
MALKPDREEFHHDIRWYMNEVAERGGIAHLQTAGSGGYPGNKNALVTYAANPSGRHPIGLLLVDMVNIDLSHQHMNFYREQAPLGAKVALMKDGWCTTNMITGTPVGGEAAYAGPSGTITPLTTYAGAKVGQFLSSKDEDGYAAVRIQINA